MRSLFALLALTAIIGAGYLLVHHNSNQVLIQDIPTPVYDLWGHWKQANGKHYGAGAEE